MKLYEGHNGNQYQSEDPHLAYPIYANPDELKFMLQHGIVTEVKRPDPVIVAGEPFGASVDPAPPAARPSRQYRRRDLNAEEATDIVAEVVEETVEDSDASA